LNPGSHSPERREAPHARTVSIRFKSRPAQFSDERGRVRIPRDYGSRRR